MDHLLVRLLYKMTHALQMGSSEVTLLHDKSAAGQSLNARKQKTPALFHWRQHKMSFFCVLLPVFPKILLRNIHTIFSTHIPLKSVFLRDHKQSTLGTQFLDPRDFAAFYSYISTVFISIKRRSWPFKNRS